MKPIKYEEIKEATQKGITFVEFEEQFTLGEAKEINAYNGKNFNLAWRDSTTPAWMFKLKQYRNFMLAKYNKKKMEAAITNELTK